MNPFRHNDNMETSFSLSPIETNAEAVAQENAREACHFAAVEDEDLTKHCFLYQGHADLHDP